MVKIQFLQKVLKKWSSFRKKNKFFFHNQGEGSGPYIEFSIIFFFFEPFPKSFLGSLVANFTLLFILLEVFY